MIVLYVNWVGDAHASGYHPDNAKKFAICRFWTSRGYEIDWQVKGQSYEKWEKQFDKRKYAHVILYNGNHSSMDHVRELAWKRNVGLTVFEGGFFRSRTFVLDTRGYGPHSTLCSDPFRWVTPDMLEEYHAFRLPYFAKYRPGAKEYILSPLQVEHDPTLKAYSNCDGKSIGTMEEWINYLDSKYPDEFIIYRPHPLHKKSHEKLEDLQKMTGNIIAEPETTDNYNSFYKACFGAKMCLGIHSHALAQALLLDIPTFAHAQCPAWRIRDGGADKLKLHRFLAACYHNTHDIYSLKSTTSWYERNYPEIK